MAKTTTRKKRTTKNQPAEPEGQVELPAPPSEPKDAQVRREQPAALAGIEFDDESVDPRDAMPEEKPAERTIESDKANQDAAKAAIERMGTPDRLRRKIQPPRVTTPDPEVQAALAPRVYRVLKDATITRGAASYLLRAGKPITNRDYNIESLQAQGVQLEEITPGG